MASLPELPSVTKLSRYVTRILGQNPSKFTLQGTNSYLVHHPSSPSLILLDTTGPSSTAALSASEQQAYLSALRSALAAHAVQPARVTDVVLTHWHRDHVAAVRGVVETLAQLRAEQGAKGEGEAVRVWKMPCSSEGGAWKSDEGRDGEVEALLAGLGGDVVSPLDRITQVRPLEAGQRFVLGPSSLSPTSPLNATGEERLAEAVELEVIPTPGHTSDSICLALRSLPSPASSPSSSASHSAPLLALFTADTVLGHGTAVFASLSAYLRSLGKLVELLQRGREGEGEVPLYSGHGEVVKDGLAKVREYKAHREERERQVVEALRAGGKGKTATASDLTDLIYASSIPASLKPAATHGLLLHLSKLEEDGCVVRVLTSSEVSAELEGKGEESHGEVVVPPGWADGWRWCEGEGNVGSEVRNGAGRL
ncbi:hypothetical protein JCM10207_001813 [Rhodosporidiobolus poonsookiae]